MVWNIGKYFVFILLIFSHFKLSFDVYKRRKQDWDVSSEDPLWGCSKRRMSVYIF